MESVSRLFLKHNNLVRFFFITIVNSLLYFENAVFTLRNYTSNMFSQYHRNKHSNLLNLNLIWLVLGWQQCLQENNNNENLLSIPFQVRCVTNSVKMFVSFSILKFLLKIFDWYLCYNLNIFVLMKLKIYFTWTSKNSK